MNQETSNNRALKYIRRTNALCGIVLVSFATLLCLGPRVLAASPVIDIRGTMWGGAEVFKGRLQGFGAVKYTGTASLLVDSGGHYVYTDPDGVQFSGEVVQTKRRLRLTYAPEAIAAVEAQLADIIVEELSSAGIDPGAVNVIIDRGSIRLTAALRSKRGVNAIAFTSTMRFTATSAVYGTRRGAFTTKAILTLLDQQG